MSLPPEDLMGRHENANYRTDVAEIKDERPWADCSDRNSGFEFWSEHKSGDTSV